VVAVARDPPEEEERPSLSWRAGGPDGRPDEAGKGKDRAAVKENGMSATGQGGLDFDVRFGSRGANQVPAQRFRILVVGDFSGRRNRGRTGLPTGARTLAFDCDNLEELPGSVGASLELGMGEAGTLPLSLTFGELEDLHPDRIYGQVPTFGRLRDLRKRLQSTATFDDAARELQEILALPSPEAATPAPEEPLPVEPPPAASEAVEPQDDFARLLGQEVQAQAPSVGKSNGGGAVNALIRDLVAPHIVKEADPRRDELLAAVDAAAGAQMRAILHHPDFRAMEAAWRGAEFFVHNVETDEELELRLLDLSKEELTADFGADRGLEQTELFRILVHEACRIPGAVPWTLIVGLYDFTTGDAALLNLLGGLAAMGGATFLGGLTYDPSASPEGQVEGDAAWQALRQSPAAGAIGLSVPRVMMRLPYGAKTEPLDRFDFEEIAGAPSTGDYLWGTSAVACACMLAQAYSQQGRGFRPGAISEIGSLPLHVYKQDGESKMTPCAEGWLSDGDAEDLIATGIIPVMSIRGRDAVRVEQFVALSGAGLKVG